VETFTLIYKFSISTLARAPISILSAGFGVNLKRNSEIIFGEMILFPL